MKKNGTKFGIILIVLVILGVSTIFYIQENYFFNPLNFKKSAFLYNSWNAYKKPMSMDMAGGSSPRKVVKNPKQIRFVMNEIEKESNNKVSVPKGNNFGPEYVIFFHSGKVTFQQVQIYPDVNIVQFVSEYKNSQVNVEKPKYVPLSPELLSYVKKKLG